jgi:transposase
MRAEVWVGPERRRRWSIDEKLQVVREAFAPAARVADVARRRDVSRAQIYQWPLSCGTDG